MVSVFDVTKFILSKMGSITAMKLQKLIYYCQAWSLVWDGEPLFEQRIEAWASGPVVYDLYQWHKGKYRIDKSDIDFDDIRNLSKDQKETISSVIEYYSDKSPQWLSDLTHMEDPWRMARKGLADGERGRQEITLGSMEEYYSSILPETE